MGKRQPKTLTAPISATTKAGCPFSIKSYSVSDLSYGEYLKVPGLLKLQQPQSVHHDELLFIIIHQTYELWFKLILHELQTVIQYLQKDNVYHAHHFLKRVVEVMKVLIRQIHILETMTPFDFLKFRDHLKPASGFQSIQFREIEFIAGLKDERYFEFFANQPDLLQLLKQRFNEPDLRTSFYDMLRRLKFDIPEQNSVFSLKRAIRALKPLYQSPQNYGLLYFLTETLVDFDMSLCLWREHHVNVVERVIGFKAGTGGSTGVDYLRSTLHKRCFPELLELRTCL